MCIADFIMITRATSERWISTTVARLTRGRGAITQAFYFSSPVIGRRQT
jgi:hypothetical protein